MMKVDDIKYIVKPEERLVIGIYKKDDLSIAHDIVDGLDDTFWHMSRWELTDYVSDVKHTYRAFARCNEEDEFNAEYGMKLVRAKLEYKVDRAYHRVSKIIRNRFDKMMVDILTNGVWKYSTRVNNDARDLYDYYGVKMS